MKFTNIVGLERKVALVTGATSGIGEASASHMAKLGAMLMLSGRDVERGRRVTEEITSSGGNASFIAGDVRDPGFCQHLVDTTCQRFGTLDVLVNSAGISRGGSALETTDQQWHDTIAVNLTALFFLSRAALSVMKGQGGGSIVNVASDWGLVGGRNAAAYCASKGAVVLLTKAMALDHAKDNIRINAICPGDTDTAMMMESFRRRGLTYEEGKAGSAAGIPMGRMATAVEIAHVISFLASDSSSFITGVALPVDGGNTAA
jgi:meso-butanediol dehydrogenase / (S,S)-butanediol dehydrogenase / diacetyl reductase